MRGTVKGILCAGLPLVFSVAADILGGVTTDALSRRLGIRIGRCGVGAVGVVRKKLIVTQNEEP